MDVVATVGGVEKVIRVRKCLMCQFCEKEDVGSNRTVK